MLMPVSGVFAEEFDYQHGLLDSLYIKDITLKETAYDNDLNTNVIGSDLGYVEFEVPMIINAIFTETSGMFPYFDTYFLDENGNELLQFNERDGDGYQTVSIDNVKKIILRKNAGTTYYETDFFGEPMEEVKLPIKDVTNLAYEKKYNEINLNWQNPAQEHFSHVLISFNEQTYETTEQSYRFENLESNKEYDVFIQSVDNQGLKSDGISLTAKTDNVPSSFLGDIKEINADASHDRVDLSWSLPETEYFEHVNIYRKSVSDVQTFSLLSVDAYDPLFETNGTYFNDLTVEEQTTYDYKLTTEFQGLESEGVTVQATTLVAPPPELGGQEFEEQENGDYLVSWQQPEAGQVRILVDGKEYVVVPASDKQFTIPAADMKYGPLGNPLVSIQTIGDNGEESEIVDSGSNIDLPFGVGELIETSAGLMKVIGSLILLGLSFILVPKFVKMIKQSLSSRKNERERIEREQRVSERAYREPRESRISTREGRTSTRVPREFRKGE